MLILVVRTLILYGMVIAAMRIMGKRQLGELQPSELVVAIMISDLASVPASVCRVFDDQFVTGNEAKRVFVSLGIFSIIKIERHVQLLIPSYDFCIPQKECVGATDDNPCDLFERIDFPVDEFFPPERGEFLECDQDDISEPEDDSDCGCRR